jgi:hypothetical protein
LRRHLQGGRELVFPYDAENHCCVCVWTPSHCPIYEML